MLGRLAPLGLLIVVIGISWGGYELIRQSHSRAAALAEGTEVRLGEPDYVFLMALVGTMVLMVICVAVLKRIERRPHHVGDGKSTLLEEAGS